MSKKLANQPLPWFWMGIAAVFLLSAALRFWGLSRFNTLVFDEVYYAKFANNYLTRTPFFDGHPPLSKYIIAIGMWIGGHIPFGDDSVNSLTGSLRSTWSYRWLNALTGSFIPLVIAGVAYQLSHRRSYAFLAALLAATDGLFLVESRYALNNIYLVIFGLLGQWFFLLALERHGKQRGLWLALAGIGFGASAAIKWNGLWFLLGAYLVWLVAWVSQWIVGWTRSKKAGKEETPGHGGTGTWGHLRVSHSPRHRVTSSRNQTSYLTPQTPLQNLTQLNIGQVLFYLGIIPVLVYSLEWIPHLQLNPTPGFWQVQKQILEYHQQIGSDSNVHPYCSAWYTWLWMIRPVAYFYQTEAAREPLPVMEPPLPGNAGKVIYDVHAMGNPILWWLSTVAILLLLWKLTQSLISWAIGNWQEHPSPIPPDTWIAFYLVLNWLANLMPWMRVTRCTFLYHYMGASVFAGLALSWLVDQWLHSYHRELRAMGVTVIFLILLAFVFWMPIYLGLPLSPESYKLRMWFPSWI